MYLWFLDSLVHGVRVYIWYLERAAAVRARNKPDDNPHALDGDGRPSLAARPEDHKFGSQARLSLSFGQQSNLSALARDVRPGLRQR